MGPLTGRGQGRCEGIQVPGRYSGSLLDGGAGRIGGQTMVSVAAYTLLLLGSIAVKWMWQRGKG